jgi:hypothetical protein
MVWCSFSGVVCESLSDASACTAGGGTVLSAGCPSSTSTGSLVGCCTTGSEESCYYDAAITEQSCTGKGGTWSTTWSSTP